MDTSASSEASILIVTDLISDATLLKNLLNQEFDHVFTTTDPDKLAKDFTRHRPNVLVLAFNTLEKSERHYLWLYRLCDEVHEYPHRTVILCNQDEMRRAYQLCKKNFFDDYVLFWPMTHDALRLPMTIHHALRDLAALKVDGPSATEFAAQARQLAKLEKLLDQQFRQGDLHVEIAHRALEQTEQKVSIALDGFPGRLISGALSDAGVSDHVAELAKEVKRFKREEIQPHFRAAAETTQPLKEWVQDFRQECAPHMESARALNEMAERIRPIVLVVDDDEFQCKIIMKLLEEQHYHLIFAADGIEALTILHKTPPTLILMDVAMPNMDGMTATRLLKNMPQFSKVPVIMITDKHEEQVVINSWKAGAIDFVAKPFNRATLIAKIDHALGMATP